MNPINRGNDLVLEVQRSRLFERHFRVRIRMMGSFFRWV